VSVRPPASATASPTPPAAPAPAPIATPQRRRPLDGPREVIDQVAGMTALFLSAGVALVRPPFAWRDEFLEQTVVLVRRCPAPVLLSCFFFGFGIAIQAGNLVSLLGTVDRLGAFYVNAAVREFGPWINGMVIAGVGGTAIAADLGARKVREELDALATLGVDPVAALVAPRFLALGVVTALMNMVAVVCGIAGGALGTLLLGESLAGYVATFSSNFTMPDVVGSTVKVVIFGQLIAIACCYKGMNVKGGPEGVGRAVNQAVVIAFASIWTFNYAFGSLLLAAFPETQTLR
jgi:phospholipid/cholesterol/gamma-HCH transport system permease protein